MSNTHLTGDAAVSSNFLIDGDIHKGTLSNVVDVLNLLSSLDSDSLGQRATAGLSLLLSRCADAIRHVENNLECAEPESIEPEMTLPVESADYRALEAVAERGHMGDTAEAVASRIVREWIQRQRMETPE